MKNATQLHAPAILAIANAELARIRMELRDVIDDSTSFSDIDVARQRLDFLAAATFQVSSRMKVTSGSARVGGPGRGLVKLSLSVFGNVDNASVENDAKLRNTIRHELAHIACERDADHGPVWKTAAKDFGCDAEQFHTMHTDRQPFIRWAIVCEACGDTIGRKNGRVRPTRWMNRRRSKCCTSTLKIQGE